MSNDLLILGACIGGVLLGAYWCWLTLWESGRDWHLDDDGPDYVDVYATMRKRGRR